MLIDEKLAQLEEEKELRNNLNINIEGNFLSKYTHLAIDKRVK